MIEMYGSNGQEESASTVTNLSGRTTKCHSGTRWSIIISIRVSRSKW